MTDRPSFPEYTSGAPAPHKDWHGQRIFTEDDLGRYFEGEDPEETSRRRKRRRWLHGSVITLIVLLIAAGVFVAWQVLRGQWEIPGWEAAAPPTPLACPANPTAYAQDSSVNVYNGTSVEGLAGGVANELEERGFEIGTVGNRRLGNQQLVAVVMSGPDGHGTALAVQRQFEGSQFQPDERADDSVDVVLGARYTVLVPEVDVDTEPGVLRCPDPTAPNSTTGSASPTTSSNSPTG